MDSTKLKKNRLLRFEQNVFQPRSFYYSSIATATTNVFPPLAAAGCNQPKEDLRVQSAKQCAMVTITFDNNNTWSRKKSEACDSEATALIRPTTGKIEEAGATASTKSKSNRSISSSWQHYYPTKIFGVLTTFMILAGIAIALLVPKSRYELEESSITSKEETIVSRHSNYHRFPEDFVWGTATSSYQVEGATHEGGRGVSIWDSYSKEKGKIADGSNGDVACDHYNRMEEDVQLIKSLGLKAYRFSIAWPRIFPNGKGEEPNIEGIDFYNRLIDELLKNDIEPWATLYHWDLPQSLQDEYGGWQSPNIIDDFGRYASVCFDAFGDRVKNWITLNESWTVAVQAYEDGTKAPGIVTNPQYEVYIAAHHLLLAHARAARIYRENYFENQKGKIGISNCGDFRYPLNPESNEDQDAAERAMIFQYGWLTDPLVFGDYPAEMRVRLGNRLPQFTDAQQEEMKMSIDFMGLNHYSTLYASARKDKLAYGGYWADMDVEFSSDPSWRKNYMGWSTNPDGCRELLRWISRRYGDIPIVITENGTSEDDYNLEVAKHDEGRREYFEQYIRACGEAIDLGVKLEGYFAWSLMDNFEWEYGYTRRFGLCYVDFETLERTPKLSALSYKKIVEANGSNLLKTSSLHSS